MIKLSQQVFAFVVLHHRRAQDEFVKCCELEDKT